MKRWAVPGIPFALSLCLSLATVGTHPFWQDSGLYLTAIKELGVLYAPGFVVYEVLCRAWTVLLFFVDFTLAVHLFSSVCAALASGVIAVAVRDLLRSREGNFKVVQGDAGPLAEDCGVLAGVLFASGFTVWSTAIYAKGYAFYYLVLALLIWRIVRAEESRRPRDFTIVAALIGLSWQAHPSAVLAGAALALFVAVHARRLGWKGVLGRVLVAAACALGPSLLLLPAIVARDPWLMFQKPTGVLAYLRFITGGHYVGVHGAFGYDGTRGESFLRYAWEDLLGIGLVLLAAGLVSLVRNNLKLLTGLALWCVPYSVFTILFKTEVQHDCWLVGARLPLFLVVGVGAYELAARLKQGGSWALRAAAGVAVLWASIANYCDVEQRDYLPAELYARTILETADRDAILILSGDDSNGLVSYLQRVRGMRPDLTLVTSSFLNSEATTGSPWYDDGLLKRNPGLARPDYAALRSRFPGVELKLLAVAAFINVNAASGRPILSEVLVQPDLLTPGLNLIPAGVFVKVLPPGSTAVAEERYWNFPIEPEQVKLLYRRARGQDLVYAPEGVQVKPQRYERRLAALILKARFRLALVRFEARKFAEAARLCQSIIDFDDEEFENSPEIVHLLAISYYGSGQLDRASRALLRSSQISVRKENRATAFLYLARIARSRGEEGAARGYLEQALAVPGLDESFRRELEAQRGSK
jgi:hypothetical protein